MRILVLEDKTDQQARIEKTLFAIAKDRNLKLHIDIAETYRELETFTNYLDLYELYLLDLEVDDDPKLGFTVAQEIRKRDPFTSIAFVTTHSEALPLAFEYQVSALDFISKDKPEGEYRQHLERCIDYVTQHDTRENLQVFSYRYEGRKGFSMPYHDIIAIETKPDSHRLKVYYVNHSTKTVYGTLKSIQEQAERDYFAYANRTVLVNINAITGLNSQQVDLIEGLSFSVSRMGKRELEKCRKNKD
ncbi:Response regulator of the competence regulon ComE [Streptococcus sp. DD10]|uniref:response regulator transcription factor n=1 Tax=Streptococcus sp. DD10 TaxID=1777878 RepID=UPI000797E00B|nr:response regulator transcription factor [Streptococcus sp. DD10]KXT74330.1 Response regulator of the competence regulon ComE [Streptococcus sp. DD10]